MPGISPDDAIWKKRKREDDLSLTRPTYMPSFRVEEYDCPHPLQDSNLRPRCLPRKRRHIGSYLLPQQMQSQQPSHLSPNLYTTDPYSPPISPKTLVPLHYPQSASASALRPCHICHRRPTTRQVLDAYADCDLCHERACFICLRQCDSPSCQTQMGTTTHVDADVDTNTDNTKRKICSSCAVEDITQNGAEIVRCLDCVRGWHSQWTLDDMHQD
ncbi:unnamed protein product [Penicillium salamii]|uniref:Uncharacterized protein n=1 Tax=Penicillium salamii TaxID=1612424 RepID=A0A9W4NUY2_9EURO|nr:unnamed protein product [Penicillium salamii]CAG8251592.1 unnamed protein product [Penicillium salamii]CAG8255319.1 unnamed protein product [Penicillium salamii]CAG8271472.1 unnamed protein product [Penicillium salamii]CAG8273667.1 unnamed protein product [Penicillium salamii]